MKKPCVRLEIWVKIIKWIEFMKCFEIWVKFIKWVEFTKCLEFIKWFEFWVKNLNLCRAVIASEQSERGNPKSKNNAKFMDCHAVFAKTARNDAFAVILSISEVSKNGKFSFNLCGFFCCGLRLTTRWVAFLQRLKMTKRAKRFKKLTK